MATDAQARDDGTAPEGDEDDLAVGEGAQGQSKDQQKTDAPDKGEGDDGENESEIARLRKELLDTKKAVKTLTRQRDEAQNKLAKVGQAADGADPEEVATKLREAQERIQRMEQDARRAQKIEAVREVLSDEKYAPYQGTVKYIVPTLELDDETDVGDDGRYDPDALQDAARRAVQQYAKDNPRSTQKPQVPVGGDPVRSGAATGATQANPVSDLAAKGYSVVRRFGG